MDAVIFDLDQTLLDRDRSLRDFIHWQCHGMLRPYLSNKADFIARFMELDANGTLWKDKVYAALIEEFSLTEWSVQELLNVYESCFCAFAIPRSGVIEAITHLSPHYKLGLISNGKSPFQERNFTALGIAPLFKSVIVSQAVGLRKPDPKIFLLGCQELGVSPQQAIYVGDNPIADINGAINAGLHTIFVTTSLYAECNNAHAACSDLKSLPSIVESLAVWNGYPP
ncbi:HAD family hydrolase [Acaryochloris sp. CCMEE 5410]|uniref:HAD family hydrolase n=1 Tax=Acaryochloris sp. CCMEE 5410 TaxID=310037 RepID=UPI0002484068|nr:HAD family hydrolase [Acaryochloris sp. CCMEE 5410]KAI9134716.1 HAD family hydrolase [Acaryochloris sp. CCMEE 5410]